MLRIVISICVQWRKLLDQDHNAFFPLFQSVSTARVMRALVGWVVPTLPRHRTPLQSS